MSALLESYTNSFPTRCKTCPVLLAFLHQAELAEKTANTKAKEIDGLIEGQSVMPNPVDKFMIKVNGLYLDIGTELEMRGTRAVAKLAEGAEECAGNPNADELYIYPLSLNIIDSIRKGLICQNPKLDDAVVFQLR